jgi:hypothetical protein
VLRVTYALMARHISMVRNPGDVFKPGDEIGVTAARIRPCEDSRRGLDMAGTSVLTSVLHTTFAIERPEGARS